MTQNVRHKQLIKTEAEWIASPLQLLPGELGYAWDTQIIKVGIDTPTLWKDLPNLNAAITYDGNNKRLIFS